MYTFLIVEDDPIIALEIKGYVEDLGHKVCHVYHSAEEAMAGLNEECHIALLDVNLGEGKDGIDLAEELKVQHNIPCIFITSYYDDGIIDRAKNVHPLAYILKPFEEQDIKTSIKIACSKIKPAPSKESNSPIFVKNGLKLIRINPDEVTFLKAYDMYTHIYTDGQRVTASQTLKEMEKLFLKYNFLRIHRSYVVNLDAIEGICEDELLIAQNKIPVGRKYKKELFDRILTI